MNSNNKDHVEFARVKEEEFEQTESPSGAFEIPLFEEEDQENEGDWEHDVAPEGPRDEEGGCLSDVELKTSEGFEKVEGHRDSQLEVNENHIYKDSVIPVAEHVLDDFDDVENLPLATRLNGILGRRINGKIAYISKDKNVMWDVEPIRAKNNCKTIFQMSKGYVASGAQEARTPADDCKLFVRNRNILRMRVGRVASGAQEEKTPVDAWNLFVNNEMIETITTNTNIWIDKNKDNYARERDCIQTNPAEVKAVIGLLYLGGVMKSSHENFTDIYATDGLGVDFFTLVMAKKRLQFLLRAMCFDDLNTRDEREEFDKMAAIRELFEQFVENCQSNYAVSEFVTVDKIFEPFRGKCDFRVFVGNKSAKYGLKLFAMTCARTFYTSNLEVYVGKQPEGPFEIINSSKAVVERMIQPISGSGRNITTGDHFTSLSLCADLLQNHQLTLVGSMKNDKGEIPRYFLETTGKSVGSSVYGFKQGCTLVSYKEHQNRNMILLSSLHDYGAADNDPTSETNTKPEIILFYDSSKGAVENVEKYKKTYSVARKTSRWPMRLFHSILDVAGINSFVVLKANLNEKNMTRRNFLKTLAKELCKEYMSVRVSVKATPTLTKKKTCQLLGLTDARTQPPTEDVHFGRCYRCDWRKNRASRTRCEECRRFICREHAAPSRCVKCVQFGVEDVLSRLFVVLEAGQQNRRVPPEEATDGRCYVCGSKKNRKSKKRCDECRYFICREHAAPSRCVSCTQSGEEVETGTTKIVKVKPPHNHPPNAAELEATIVRCQIRERCLQEPDLRPVDVLQEAMASCTPIVREYLQQHSDSIRRDLVRTRAAAAGGELPKKYKRQKTSSPDRNTDATSHIKEEFNDELMLEDYGDLNGALQDTHFQEAESNEVTMEDSNVMEHSSSKDTNSPFEIVVCGGIEVKKEIVEDVTDHIIMMQNPDTVPTTSKSTDSVSQTVVKNTTKPLCRGFSGSTEKIDTLDALTRLTNTMDAANKPGQRSSAGTGTLGYMNPTVEQRVGPSQPLAIAATTPSYIGLISQASYTSTTNYSTVTTTSYCPSAVTHYSAATSTAANVSNPPDTRVFQVKQEIIEDETDSFETVREPKDVPATSQSPDAVSQTVVNDTTVNATTTNYCPSAIKNYSAAISIAAYVTIPPDTRVANTSGQGQPPQNEPLSHIPDCEDPEGVFISLKNVPLERRKKTKDKLLRLVKLITELDLDPDEVRFSVTTK